MGQRGTRSASSGPVAFCSDGCASVSFPCDCCGRRLWLSAGLTGCDGSIIALSASPPVPASTVSPIPGSPIQHIVVIMQENRSFDNLFNGYPGADTVQGGMNGNELIPLKPISLGDSRDLEPLASCAGGRIGITATWTALSKTQPVHAALFIRSQGRRGSHTGHWPSNM